MHFAQSDLLPQDAMVTELFRPLADYLFMPGVTEVAVNRPGEVFVEAGPHWSRHDAPALSLDRCWALANAIASYTGQRIDHHHPILSAQLPGGQRVLVIIPPAAERETVSITIRVPDSSIRTLDEYQSDGFFDHFVWPEPAELDKRRRDLTPTQSRLIDQLCESRLADFLRLAVQAKQNIVFVGDTGSGKTSLMKSVCQHIPPQERLVTIEDVRELYLPKHGNRVHLQYAKGKPGEPTVTPAELIASTMRMKPDRVLLAELRGAEAFDFLKLLTTGHSGSISSFHAESCALALERYVFMCKEHEHAGIYDAAALKQLVALTIDVIVHIRVDREHGNDGAPMRKKRYVSEIHYDPVAKLKARFGNASLHHTGINAP
jgi:type IV secretion system protein VirB11